MPVILAKTAGFCFGVDRAVKQVYDLLEQGKRVCTLGPIIHNTHLVADLERRGVRTVTSPAEVGEGETLVIRSHGVPASVYAQIEAAGIDWVDATCPFVAKIHQIVRERSEAGDLVLVAGDPDHPEVVGIVGHCPGEVRVFSTAGELRRLAKEGDFSGRPVSMVSQTTFNVALWKEAVAEAEALFPGLSVFSTICSATASRQQEAEALSKESGLMVVVGDRKSSNTAKLREVCEKNCPTILVETADELLQQRGLYAKIIGVTAGASTPACIIKEVLHTMSELQNDVQGEDFSFEEALEESLKPIYTGQRLKGVVTSIAPNEVTVDIGTKHTGFVALSELTNDPNASADDIVKKGDEINVIVLRVNDQEGTVQLSKKRYDAIEGFDKIVKAQEEDAILTGTVTDVIKGGVLVSCYGIKVFVPASLATLRRNDDLNALKGTEAEFKVIEINERRARAIGSIKAVLAERNKAVAEAFWQSVEIGKHYTGTVKSLTSYGAFIDLGGVDGMVHISELSWKRIKHPSEVVKVGDTVEVYVKDVDFENKKISLGYKKTEDNPWVIFQRDYHVGDVIKVQIVSITSFGAFARIIDGVDGLIHISQISNERVEKVADALQVGQEVEVKITEADIDRKRVSLSIRALLDSPKREERDDDYGFSSSENNVVYSTEEADALKESEGE
ncbi:bifunctional 4-hydroxy-3-methylbut-2-enyl diphosphate reductase/30S ribosomal protein S1 [Acetanaerobacterium sp. MSJ-12]|uniref:bifunctional 4-hydroxy-3-methylbut-2-enyl diphosphate reductase/30S ribosomal protein S1 n=1 Tax=Acetanaerobacterium sp. MSJ-12 TaxID=2841535 RepID=UPI001C0E9764|nr:bifunctional 4-hydroxy-3-methylbut-2-enyl diphosphate reductase/30S ribosomal protein S1 [Acetanaerobacterium sp. MSJ-12]MBU5419671.1 bifunctional 4-hydroxy-3-methylbut-2-enyl diphosphate reductase/30S ribosomal protein S1 [Acetanaerobacterium sp. MSJ-12]